MFDAVTVWKYVGVVGTLVASGFGLPVPEELPIVFAGAMVGHDAQSMGEYGRRADAWEAFEPLADPLGAAVGGPAEVVRPARPERPTHLTRWWLMLPLIIAGVVVGDSVLYLIGRQFGRRLLHSGWVQRRVLPPDKRAEIETNFHKNGILILLGARLTPGIRTPVFLMAGVLRMPMSRFLLADCLYAIPGVNFLFWLAYLFTDQFVAAVDAVERHRSQAVLAVLAAVCGVVLYRFAVSRRLSTGDVGAIPAINKPAAAVAQKVEEAVEKTVEAAGKVVHKVAHPLGGPGKPADPPG